MMLFRYLQFLTLTFNVPPYAELDNLGIEGALAVHWVTSDRFRHPAPHYLRSRQSNQCPPLHQNQ
jgi:hypothetical protein